MPSGTMTVKSTENMMEQFMIMGNVLSGQAPKQGDRVRVVRTGKTGTVTIVSSMSRVAKEIDGIDRPLRPDDIVGIVVTGLGRGDVTANDTLEICD